MKKLYCIYHSADYDGIGSAAIVNYYCSQNGFEFVPVPFNYGQNEPNINSFENGSMAVLVDVCLQNNDYANVKLLKEKFGNDFIYIDHHITAINDLKHLNLTGLRDHNHSANYLTWQYFYPEIKTPKAIKILQENDLGRFTDETEALECALDANGFKDPTDKQWTNILNNDEILVKFLQDNKNIIGFKNTKEQESVWTVHLIKYNGKIAPAINGNHSSFYLEKYIPNLYDKYDFCVKYYRTPKFWKASLYTKKEGMDLIEFSKGQFKGHKVACGGTFKELPFEFIEDKINFE